MPLVADLPNFALSEFRHPELVEEDAAWFLQDVRTEFDEPLILASDARTPQENAAAGGVDTSWHLKGRAFDLRCWGWSWEKLWRFVDSVMWVAIGSGCFIELELVWGPRDKHIHLAVKDDGSPSELILALD